MIIRITAFIVCLFACFIGSISGLSGGVIIKPVLDSISNMGASTISFLSGCTALTMSIVSLLRSRNKGVSLDFKIALSLGIGGAIGGICGKQIMEVVKVVVANENKIGLIQSIILFTMNLVIYFYTINKNKIKSFTVKNPVICVIAGVFLGMVSSFLGIGGGPLNVALIYILFSMSPKQATLCSIVVVFFSQTASFFTSVVNGLPEFDIITLIVMCLGGIGGALIGSSFSKKMDNEKTEKFFIRVLVGLLILTLYNIIKFSLSL